MADLSGKTVILLDAATGLGAGIVAGLAEAGATFHAGGPVQVDHGGHEELLALFERVRDEHGRLDVVVACMDPLTACAAAALAAPVVKGGLIINVLPAGDIADPHEAAQTTQRTARESAPHGIAALALAPDPSAHFTGRCCAALAMDPDIVEKSGGLYRVAALAAEYRFSRPDEVPPRSW